MEKPNEREIEFIQTAAKFLEHPGFLIQATNLVGKPLEAVQNSLPAAIQKKISSVTEKALRKTLDISISTLKSKVFQEFPRQPLQEGTKHTWVAGLTGAVGGFFGPAALAIELPISTGIMFRSIANIAQSFGEDLNDPETRLQCLQVFAMGSPHTDSDDAMKSAYFSQRWALNTFLKQISEKGAASILSRMITRVATRYELVVAEKIVAEALPVLGAVGGAAINAAFTEYFNKTGYYHFGLRHLERKYGPELVEKLYLESLSTGTANQKPS